MNNINIVVVMSRFIQNNWFCFVWSNKILKKVVILVFGTFINLFRIKQANIFTKSYAFTQCIDR